MKDFHAELYRFKLPLTAPLRLAHGTLDHREGLLFRIVDDDGVDGWGEASPLPGFSRESLPDAKTSLTEVIKSEEDFEATMEHARPASVTFAMDGALQSYMFNKMGIVLARSLWPNAKPEIHVQALLAGERADVLARAAELRKSADEEGPMAKLKVGLASLDDDAERVSEVADALGSDFALRLDANGLWSLPEATAFATKIQGIAIEYIEEPTGNPAEFPEFRETAGIPFALDESLRRSEALPEQTLVEAAAYVVKPSLQVLEPAPGFEGMPWTFSAAFESGVGLAALAVRAFGANPYQAVGLDTYAYLADDVLEERLPVKPGKVNIDVLAKAALRVDMNKLERII